MEDHRTADRDIDAHEGELWLACQKLNSKPQEAIAELSDLAASGSVRAMVILGDAYLYGRFGLEVDRKFGSQYLERARLSGSNDAAYRLSKYYIDQSNFQTAETELKRLAKEGYVPAISLLANELYEGKWLPKDIDLAIELWERASASGHLPSMRWLSHIYRKGHLGVLKKIRGLMLSIKLTILLPYFMIRHPESERLRNW